MLDALITGRRSSGVLLHPTSLPGPGIGDLGESAHRFVDWLSEGGQSFWQILPLVPTDAGGSPYNGLSALAGNTLLISPALLRDEGLLEDGDATRGSDLPKDHIDYPAVANVKGELLELAHRRFRKGAAGQLREPFEAFLQANQRWLPDYSLYRALRKHYRDASWLDWPAEIRVRQPEAVERWHNLLADEVELHSFQQFLFDRQWRQLLEHAHSRGIRIIGDLPIFVAHDSADVWANSGLFRLEPDGLPSVVAGVPPDYFSETGQLWGNPLYRWNELRDNGYAWWVERFRRTLDLVDVIRMDHFRGFEAYWEIPAGAKTAIDGRWVEGPGANFFHTVERRLGKLPLIAEDLGLITPEVERLRDEMGFPGMRVLQFAFDGDPRNTHLPDNYTPTSVAYTGTHDNDTVAGWWHCVRGDERDRVREWMGKRSPKPWDFVEAVLSSDAAVAIIPLQDILGLGSEGRMNTPGRASENWTWRVGRDLPAHRLAERLRALTASSQRLHGIGA